MPCLDYLTLTNRQKKPVKPPMEAYNDICIIAYKSLDRYK